jgi:hypothetical protein
MHSNITPTELNLLQSSVTKLEYELKAARLTIDTYCSNIKSKIDLQAEIMIKKINEERSDLISQVDKYQEELFQGLDRRIDKLNVESIIKKAQDLIESQPSRIDLIQQQTDIVRIVEQSLREKIFGNNLIDFEPTENPWENLGRIFFDQQTSLIKEEAQTSECRLIKCQLGVFYPITKIAPLANCTFLVIKSDLKSAPLTILSGDRLVLKCRKSFINMFSSTFHGT